MRGKGIIKIEYLFFLSCISNSGCGDMIVVPGPSGLMVVCKIFADKIADVLKFMSRGYLRVVLFASVLINEYFYTKQTVGYILFATPIDLLADS